MKTMIARFFKRLKRLFIPKPKLHWDYSSAVSMAYTKEDPFLEYAAVVFNTRLDDPYVIHEYVASIDNGPFDSFETMHEACAFVDTYYEMST